MEELEAMQKGFWFQDGVWVFRFGDGYELCFEPFLTDDEMYMALYKDQNLLTNKVVVKLAGH